MARQKTAAKANVTATAMDKEKLIELGKKYLWLGFERDDSFFDRDGAIMAYGDGCWWVDVDGNRYLEIFGSQGMGTVGYNHPYMIEAMLEQMKKVSSNASLWPVPIPAILLAEKLATLVPKGLTKTFFGLTGSDANETAIKIARQYFQMQGKASKYKTVTRWGGYHGSTLAMNAASGHTHRRISFGPLPDGFIHINMPYCYRCPYKMTYPGCDIECAEEFRRMVELEGPSTIACFLGELTAASGGRITPPPEYPQRIREICNQYDILMIIDEVVTGFGRTGTWFECEQYGIIPDILTTGKSITGGYAPLSATTVKQEIAETFTGKSGKLLHHGFTMGANPLSCAAGLANIELIEKLELIVQVPQKAAFLMAELEKIKENSRSVGTINGKGLLVGLEMVKNKKTRERLPVPPEEFAQVAGREGRKVGLHVSAYGSRIQIGPSLIITMDELKFLVDGLAKVIQGIEAEFL